MKNWNIRKKLIPLYLVISFFTFLLFFAALFLMRSVNANSAEEGAQLISTFGWLFLPYLLVYFLMIFTIGRMVAKQVAFPAQELLQAAQKVAKGNVDIELTNRAGDEIGRLTDSFREMVVSIQEQAQVLSTIAEGDYTPQIEMRDEKDVMNRAIIDMLNNTKSADAAKETNQLISQSRQRVQEGNGVVGLTEEALAAVEDLAGQTQQLVGGISDASAQQSQSIVELTMGIDQISQVVQANSATAEQSAAAAQEMSAQADLLSNVVARFKLREESHLALPEAHGG